MVEELPVLTVTGITGYIASWVTLFALKSGKYKVRGTVRNTQNAEKINPIREAFGRYFDELELVQADLLEPESV